MTDTTEPLALAEAASAEHWIKAGRAVCLGDRSSKCHTYPACDCEYWEIDEATLKHEHPDVQHDECWLIPWLDTGDLEDTATDEAASRRDRETLEFPDGEIFWEWEGEYAIWGYAHGGEPQ